MCDRVACGDSCHGKSIDNYCAQIIQIMSDATVWGSKVVCDNSSKLCWNGLLDDAKMNARVKYKIWLQSRKALCSDVYDNMVNARKLYKKEIKKAKNSQKNKRRAYVENLLEHKDSWFWKKWKNFNNCRDGGMHDDKLANGLLHNFNKKFVNSSDNTLLVNEFLKKYEDLAYISGSDGSNTSCDFSIEFIENCVKELHLKRAADCNELTVENIVYAHPIIYCHLKNLFESIFQHGHVPADFNFGVIIPVVKDCRKDHNNVDNYRPVTIVSVISNYLKCVFIRISVVT